MDSLAKDIIFHHISSLHHSPPHSTYSFGIGLVFCGDQYISLNLQQSLYFLALHMKFVMYVSSKFELNPVWFNKTIAWSSFNKA